MHFLELILLKVIQIYTVIKLQEAPRAPIGPYHSPLLLAIAKALEQWILHLHAADCPR
jgi:hypothetical protein